MTYRLKVNQQWKIALALILVPVLIMFLYVPFILAFHDLPDWAILVSVFVVLGLTIGATLLVISRWLTVECAIRLDEAGLHFQLTRETPFMHLHEFRCNWANIGNVALNEDVQHDTVYYSIEFRNPGMTLYLTDIPKHPICDSTGSAFWQELNGYVGRYNQSTQDPSLEIGHAGFYDRPWAKALTYVTLTITVLVIVGSVFSTDEGRWWRVAGFSAYAIPWLLNYYTAVKKRKTQQP